MEVGKKVRIEERLIAKGRDAFIWKTVPNGASIQLWEKHVAEAVNEQNQPALTRHIFHIPFVAGLARGNRVTYLGTKFAVLKVSDSPKLLGLELLCELA